MSQKAGNGTVSFEEVKSLSGNTNCDTLIIDVREPNELKETGVIPRSINIPCNYYSCLKVSVYVSNSIL